MNLVNDSGKSGGILKADTHEGFRSRSMLQDHFARVSTQERALFAPGACSQVFNRLNIVEHFAGWKFCSRGWSIPMKSLVHTEELCSRSVPLEHAPGAKPLVCIGLKTLGNRNQKSPPFPNRTWRQGLYKSVTLKTNLSSSMSSTCCQIIKVLLNSLIGKKLNNLPRRSS